MVYTTIGACPYKGMWYQDITTLETTRYGVQIGVQNGTPRSGTTYMWSIRCTYKATV